MLKFLKEMFTDRESFVILIRIIISHLKLLVGGV